MRKPRHILVLLCALVGTIHCQLSCHRIPTSFCCTSRIRDQCPEQCASVQCGQEFIHSLFSTDGSRKQSSGAHDGSAVVGSSVNPDGITSIAKPDQPAVAPFSFETALSGQGQNSQGWNSGAFNQGGANSGDARVGTPPNFGAFNQGSSNSGDARVGTAAPSNFGAFNRGPANSGDARLRGPAPTRFENFNRPNSVDSRVQGPPPSFETFETNSGDAGAPVSQSFIQGPPETTPNFEPSPTTPASSGFPTLIPFSSESNLWSTVTQQPLPSVQPSFAPRRDPHHRRRTTPDPRIIRPPESLVVIGDYDEDEPPSENAVVDSPQPIPTTTTPAPPVISNSGDVFARSRKEISATPDEAFNSGTASASSGSSHEWKVSIIPRGQSKTASVNPIPPLTIDGKSDERFNKFYRTIDKVINKLEITPGGELHVREGEPQIRLEGSTKDLNVESSAVVIVPRTTVAPGVTNRVSVVPFRPLRFTAPPHGAPPGVAPPAPAPAPAPSSTSTCGVAPDFTPCVSNEIASKRLLECCQRKNLPPGCQQLCRYNITQTEIRAAMDRGQCGIFNVAPFLECASQGKDNSECCRHRGIVQKTGPQCEQFCRPAQGLSALGVQHIVCGNAVGDMLHCHHSGVRI